MNATAPLIARGAALVALAAGACTVPEMPPPQRRSDRAPVDAGLAQATPVETVPPLAAAPPAWDATFEEKPRSTKLPVVWLDVEGHHFDIPRDGKVKGRIRVFETHDGTHRDLATRAPTLDHPMGITVRGSSSSSFPQRSYTVELQRPDGRSARAPVLDMPPAEDWALVTCWGDRTCMRNALGLWMARQFGRWSARARFVEVFLNGRYNGIHALTEAIRSDASRVNVRKPAGTPEAGDISGGYIFRKEAGGKGSSTANPPRDWLSSYAPREPSPATGRPPPAIVYTYHYPRHHSITAEQRAYLKDYMARFEAMMESADWKDPRTGYPAWIDVTSWIDYALVGEVANDIDHYFKSVYWVKASDRDGGKLYQTPAWDFDRVFGNAYYRDGFKVDNRVYRMNEVFGGECSSWLAAPEGCPRCSFDFACVPSPGMKCNPCHNVPYVPFYWDRLWADPDFQDQLKCRWHELRKTAFDPARVEERVARWKGELAEAIPRHYTRWQAPLYGRVVSEQYLSPFSTDVTRLFEDEVRNLVESVRDRIAWLDANLPGRCRR